MHCVKSVPIRRFFDPYFPVFGPEKTPYLDNFYTVMNWKRIAIFHEYFKCKLQFVSLSNTAWKVSKYGVFSASYFLVFSPNIGKYKPEKTPYLHTFQAVWGKKKSRMMLNFPSKIFSSFSSEDTGSYLYKGYAISHRNT